MFKMRSLLCQADTLVSGWSLLRPKEGNIFIQQSLQHFFTVTPVGFHNLMKFSLAQATCFHTILYCACAKHWLCSQVVNLNSFWAIPVCRRNCQVLQLDTGCWLLIFISALHLLYITTCSVWYSKDVFWVGYHLKSNNRLITLVL